MREQFECPSGQPRLLRMLVQVQQKGMDLGGIETVSSGRGFSLHGFECRFGACEVEGTGIHRRVNVEFDSHEAQQPLARDLIEGGAWTEPNVLYRPEDHPGGLAGDWHFVHSASAQLIPPSFVLGIGLHLGVGSWPIMATPPPRVFISYAWGDDKYKARVLQLAAALRTEAGVDVVLDSWDLRAGQDMTVFMERVVGDPSITNVLLLLDANYVRKADARHGGVGIETQLLAQFVYGDPQQTRVVPLLFNTGEGWTGLPHYLKSRLYFDFGTDEAWAANWRGLVRHIHQVAPVRPPLGPIPLDLLQEETPLRSPTPAPVRVIPTDLAEPYKQIYDRLHRVLDWHGLDSLRAATLLAPYGFSPGVLASPSRTVEQLDEAALTFITSYFQVSREFLLGRSREPGVRAGYWYKHPQKLCQRIAELHVSNQLGTVFFIARQSSKVLGDRRKRLFPPSLTEPDGDLFVLLTLQRQVDGHEFHTYEVWEAGLWSHEPCRLDLKAIALFCQRLNQKRNVVFFRGGALSDNQFEAVTQCRRHIAELVEDGYVGLSPKWYPDDYVSDAPRLAKETGEMPRVLEEYDWYGLERIVEAVPARSGGAVE